MNMKSLRTFTLLIHILHVLVIVAIGWNTTIVYIVCIFTQVALRWYWRPYRDMMEKNTNEKIAFYKSVANNFIWFDNINEIVGYRFIWLFCHDAEKVAFIKLSFWHFKKYFSKFLKDCAALKQENKHWNFPCGKHHPHG